MGVARLLVVTEANKGGDSKIVCVDQQIHRRYASSERRLRSGCDGEDQRHHDRAL